MSRHLLSHFSTFSESKILSFSNIHKETEQNKRNSLKKTRVSGRSRETGPPAKKEPANPIKKGGLGFLLPQNYSLIIQYIHNQYKFYFNYPLMSFYSVRIDSVVIE